MITGEQGAGKLASPVREETDGKGPGQGHLVGGRLHSEGGCTEKARIHRKRTRDLAVQPTLHWMLSPNICRLS